jgi:hypothetical protein
MQTSERALVRARELQGELAGSVRSLTAAINFDDDEQQDPSEILCMMLGQLVEGTGGTALTDLVGAGVGNLSVCNTCGAPYCREDGVEMVLPIPAFKVSALKDRAPHGSSCCRLSPDAAFAPPLVLRAGRWLPVRERAGLPGGVQGLGHNGEGLRSLPAKAASAPA